MLRIFKALLTLLVIAFLGVVGYAYFGNMKPEPKDVHQPVDLKLGG